MNLNKNVGLLNRLRPSGNQGWHFLVGYINKQFFSIKSARKSCVNFNTRLNLGGKLSGKFLNSIVEIILDEIRKATEKSRIKYFQGHHEKSKHTDYELGNLFFKSSYT